MSYSQITSSSKKGYRKSQAVQDFLYSARTLTMKDSLYDIIITFVILRCEFSNWVNSQRTCCRVRRCAKNVPGTMLQGVQFSGQHCCAKNRYKLFRLTTPSWVGNVITILELIIKLYTTTRLMHLTFRISISPDKQTLSLFYLSL